MLILLPCYFLLNYELNGRHDVINISIYLFWSQLQRAFKEVELISYIEMMLLFYFLRCISNGMWKNTFSDDENTIFERPE